MVLVVFSFLGWLSVMVFLLLRVKLDPVANALIYMGLSIIDINRLTIMSHMYGFIHISTDYPHFLSFVIYRNIASSFLLLLLVNIFFLSSSRGKKLGILFITFSVYLGLNQLVKTFNVYTFTSWSVLGDTILITAMLFISLVIGFFVLKIVKTRAV